MTLYIFRHHRINPFHPRLHTRNSAAPITINVNKMLLRVRVTKTIILLLLLLWVSSVLYSQKASSVCVGHHCPWDTSQSTILFNVMESWRSPHCGFTITIIILVMAACCVVACNILLLLLLSLSCSRVQSERSAGQSPAILSEYGLNENDSTPYISHRLPKIRVATSDNQVL